MVNRKIKAKIQLPVWIVSAFALLVSLHALHSLNDILFASHLVKVRSQVESAVGIIQFYHDSFEAGLLGEEDAKLAARDAVRAMEFNRGDRVFAFDTSGTRIIGATREEEGTSAWGSAHTGAMVAQALAGGGVTFYTGHRVQDGVRTENHDKAAWSQYFGPWGWVISSATYLEDVRNAFWQRVIELAGLFCVAAIIVAAAVHRVVKNITAPIEDMTNQLVSLADGNTGQPVVGIERKDEIGDMARAMVTLKSHVRDRQLFQTQLTELAFSDVLTSLPNRTAFRKHLAQTLGAGAGCLLVLIDLDRFKTVNDTLGHKTGDEVLLQVARRLVACLGPGAIVGRLGGDEFFAIVPGDPDITSDSALFATIALEIARPIVLEAATVELSASLGVVSSEADAFCENNLFRLAEVALHAAKKAGGNAIRHYTPELDKAASERFRLESMMNDGLRQGEFSAAFQAKVDLCSGQITGAEALCRWRHPTMGFISPTDFIPVAEEGGQILTIGTFMLREASAFAVACRHAGAEGFKVAVNVSPRQLLYGDLLSTIKEIMSETGCDPTWLQIEITESLLLEQNTSVLDTLEGLSKLGVELALDDFGTGYSALGYLIGFPISCIKIDQSFVRAMPHDHRQEVLVGTIIAMAHGLGKTVVAEGVETALIADKLRSMGCEYGQGYHWHRPSGGDELLKHLSARLLPLADLV